MLLRYFYFNSKTLQIIPRIRPEILVGMGGGGVGIVLDSASEN